MQADDNPMTEGNYMIVACINALKLIRLSKHFCGSAYLHPQHLLHELSYEQKPVTQILMTKFWLRDLFSTFSVLLSKLFLSMPWRLCEGTLVTVAFSYRRVVQNCGQKKSLALEPHPAAVCFGIGRHVEMEGEKVMTFLGATEMRWRFSASRKLEHETAVHLPPVIVPEGIPCPVFPSAHSTHALMDFPTKTLRWGNCCWYKQRLH